MIIRTKTHYIVLGRFDMSSQFLGNFKEYQFAYASFIHTYGQVIPIEYMIETTNDVVSQFSCKIPSKYSIISEKSNQSFNVFLDETIARRKFRDAMTHQLGFLESIERLYDVSDVLSQQHQRLKMIISEFDRIIEHLTWFYELFINSGIPLFNPLLSLQNRIVSILSQFFSIKNNNITSCLGFGEIRISFTEDSNYRLQALLIDLIEKFESIKEKIFANNKLKVLLFAVGLMDTAVAIRTGTAGPIARASSVDQDLRTDDPYFDYLSLGDFKLAQSYDQDIYGLVKVLLTEISVSFEIIQKILRQDFLINPVNVLNEIDVQQNGQMIARLETSKGPTLYSLECSANAMVTGFGISTPGLANLHSLETRLKGVPIHHVTRIIHAYNITDLSLMKI